MKKLILILTVFSAVIAISCNTPAQKVENAKENVSDAKEELDEARQAYIADVEKFRKETAARIEANNQTLRDFNTKVKNEKKEAQADYRNKIADLERKNNDMKKKMDDYNVSGNENWETFKTEFNRDMDELGTAFKNLTVKNTKTVEITQ